MYIYFILVGWVVGISLLGYPLPQHVNLFLVLGIGANLLLILFHYFNYKIIGSIYFKLFRTALITLLSGLIGWYYADSALDQRLNLRDAPHGQIEHIIYIAHINKVKQKTTISGDRFSNTATIQQKVQLLAHQQTIQLLLYVNPSQAELLKLGQYYRVTGQIKPVHGFAVEGTFDKEKWSIQENILGILHPQSIDLIAPDQVKRMGYAAFIDRQQVWWKQAQLKIEKLRFDFRNLIAHSSLQHKGLLLALLTGDESLLPSTIQDLFKKTGISHLLAISGPHVLIFATLFCFLFNLFIKQFSTSIFLKVPRPYLMVYPFLICVVFYTAFVGFEIPALRTMLTIIILSLIIVLKQKIQPLKHLLLAASILLLLDPFSILSAAFALSFGTCFILIRIYQTIQRQDQQQILTWKMQAKRFIYVLIESQWKIFIALMPLVLWVFQQFSWLAPVSNLIAIPMMAMIVPIEIIAAALSIVSEPIGLWIFQFSDLLLSILVAGLDLFDQSLGGGLRWWAFSQFEIFCLALALFILFLPQGTVPKFWALLCLSPLLLPQQSPSIFQLDVLDVGQGQAVLIRLPQHKMLIDTGGSWDETQFSIAQQVMLPYLMRQGIRELDQVILTHLDQDHSGAFTQITEQIKIDKVLSNEQHEDFKHYQFEYCQQGQVWQYAEIRISILSPAQNKLSQAAYNKNEQSCVVYIQVPQSKSYQNFLLMGDAGWETEFGLLQQYPDLKVDVLVLGHHGSQNSSSYAFLKQLQPKLVIVSAGYNNRYGHPHPIVLKRLAHLNIPLKSTSQQGTIQIDLHRNGEMKINGFRDSLKWLGRAES
ncbi:DNA internalization-related competence protein ComEC/Rec2 [Acinetobacter nematophilus]|uniref:DNA internalization-related competence protein ComEC/Rec2 n=1 Tax=Acinetobacter nematophilus TaxID=2994642 RepID=UPI003AF8783E